MSATARAQGQRSCIASAAYCIVLREYDGSFRDHGRFDVNVVALSRSSGDSVCRMGLADVMDGDTCRGMDVTRSNGRAILST